MVKKSKNGTRIYTKTYFKAKIEKKNGCYFIDKIDRSIPPTSLEYVENTYSNDNAKKNFDALKLGKKFDYPKPVALIDHILSLFPKTSVVLDFFAGSGTNITYPRIKTVITGKCVDGSEYSEGIPANLKYFKTDFVDKDSEDLSDELLNHIKEMIELEHSIKVDNQQYVIILTDEDMDKFEQNIEKYANLKAVFVNQDILLTATQQKLLDSINSYIIPDYYFDFELREAGELW